MWILLIAVLTGSGPVFQVGMTDGQESCVEAMRNMQTDDLDIVRKALKENGIEVKAWRAWCVEFKGEKQGDNKGKIINNGRA